MSRYFPHPAFAEDQRLSRTILLTHIATRAITSGTLAGIATSTILSAVRPSALSQGATIAALPLSRRILSSFSTARLLRASSTGTMYTIGLISFGTVYRMWGREHIEWQDRSWRLMENKGQLECDDWTYGGMALGAGWATALRTGDGPLLRRALGGMGIGSLLGMVGYMGWRYGVNSGTFPDETRQEKSAL